MLNSPNREEGSTVAQEPDLQREICLASLKKAIDLAGGQAPLARKATKFHPRGKKLTQGMIWKWLNKSKELVPTSDWVIPIEEAVRGQVKRGELRSDLYPPEQLALDVQSLKAA